MAAALAALILAVTLFSAFFIAEHADHHCKGGDCPVCACIHQCESMLRGCGGVSSDAHVYLQVLMVFAVFAVMRYLRNDNTPVACKVRMND